MLRNDDENKMKLFSSLSQQMTTIATEVEIIVTNRFDELGTQSRDMLYMSWMLLRMTVIK